MLNYLSSFIVSCKKCNYTGKDVALSNEIIINNEYVEVESVNNNNNYTSSVYKETDIDTSPCSNKSYQTLSFKYKNSSRHKDTILQKRIKQVRRELMINLY